MVLALENEIIKGAGPDVYEAEPTVNPKLLELKNVFLLPHLGSATEETREAMGMSLFSNIAKRFLRVKSLQIEWYKAMNSKSSYAILLELFKVGVTNVQPRNIFEQFLTCL